MRTDQFLNGYDSCRSALQNIIAENEELQKDKRLMELAQFPYYKNDGKDWHPDCKGCDFWQQDMDYNYYCIKEIKIEDIEDRCTSRRYAESNDS